ncbi:hypothetical protein CCP3SC15_840007 [Gammaproteobacteria bacterium]
MCGSVQITIKRKRISIVNSAILIGQQYYYLMVAPSQGNLAFLSNHRWENDMKKTIMNIVKYSALAVIVGVAAGCASSETTKMIEENQKAIAQVTATANDASRKADAAMSAARAAQECCTRSYKKSMDK